MKKEIKNKEDIFKTINGVLVEYLGNEKNVIIPEYITEIGDNVFYENNDIISIFSKNIKKTGSDCFYSCAALTEISLPDKKILVEYLDNIVTYIIRKRKNVIIGGINLCVNDSELKYDECFIVTDGVNFSHGKSIKEAKKSLLYKISNRDTTKYKSMNLDSVLTLKEGIEAYRVITGACEFGVKNFIEGLGKAKSKYTIKEIIKITKGCYGNNTFSNFFNKNK